MTNLVIITEIAMIAAVAENRVVGHQGQMPWRLSSDLRHFKALTEHKIVIMGRKTYESIGKPLPNRRNFIVTRQSDHSAFDDDCHLFHTLDEAISAARMHYETHAAASDDDTEQTIEKKEIMIIGGGQIYREALPMADRIYLTEVHATPQGDTHFPAINLSDWKQKSRHRYVADEKNQFDYSFVVLDRVAY